MTTNIQEAERWKAVLSEVVDYLNDKEESVELPDKPTAEQLKSALEGTRTQVALALEPMIAQLDLITKDMDKLRNHRHDFSKTFSGRAEF